MPQKLKEDPLFSSGIVCYAEKTEKNLFGSVPWTTGTI